MLRKSILYLSRQQRVFNFIRNVGFARKMASRFVAGETIAEACDAVAALNPTERITGKTVIRVS